MHRNDDRRHESVDVLFCLFGVDRIFSADGNEQNVHGQNRLDQRGRAFFADVAEVAHFQPVHAEFENEVFAPFCTLFFVVIAFYSRNSHAAEIVIAFFADHGRIPLYRHNVIVIVMRVADGYDVGRNAR